LSNTRTFNAPAEEFLLDFCNGGISKTPYKTVINVTMSIRLDTVLTLVRQTDGRTELVKQYRALHALPCLLTLDKNDCD